MSRGLTSSEVLQCSADGSALLLIPA